MMLETLTALAALARLSDAPDKNPIKEAPRWVETRTCAIPLKEIRVRSAKRMDPMKTPSAPATIDPIAHRSPVPACTQ